MSYRGVHVTRTCHTRTCAACDGSGSVTVNETNPYGYGPDPQCDEDVECSACDGDGEVVVWTDPLLRMRKLRRLARFWDFAPATAVRAEALSPVLLPADLLPHSTNLLRAA